ncbi:ATP-binding cassette domain-containing protein [Candidatus Mycoplasma pogonae]
MKIKVDKIIKTYDKALPTFFRALDEVSATINQGEFVAIIGQTGSGKTTFIEHLNALILADYGQVEFFFSDFDQKTQQDVEMHLVAKKNFFNRVKKAKQIRKRVGVVFQFAEYQLFESTVEKDIMFGPISMGVAKEEAKERAKEYLEIVGLDEKFLQQSPLELSGGQKRRVALAGILAMEPDFIVLDEPTAGLDPAGVYDTMEIFAKLHKQGKTVIIATHDLDNVLHWSERVLFFYKGKILRDEKTLTVLNDVEFLRKYSMEPPKIIEFTNRLKSRGIDLGNVRSIDEIAEKLNEYLKNKRKGK